MNKTLVVLAILVFLFVLPLGAGFCSDLSRLNRYFLSGDYKAAIIEGEKILAAQQYSSGQDELYYILGLSYLKDGNYLRASDIFEIIQHEFKHSRYKDDARMSQGDVYMLRDKLPEAQKCYEELVNKAGQRLKPQLYYRLIQVALRTGDTKSAQEYSARYKKEFPMGAELDINVDSPIAGQAKQPEAIFYFVQVGSFANELNAKKLAAKLQDKGFTSYMDKVTSSSGDIVYKVRVGRFDSRNQAVDLSDRLSKEGYPTKIFP